MICRHSKHLPYSRNLSSADCRRTDTVLLYLTAFHIKRMEIYVKERIFLVVIGQLSLTVCIIQTFCYSFLSIFCQFYFKNKNQPAILLAELVYIYLLLYIYTRSETKLWLNPSTSISFSLAEIIVTPTKSPTTLPDV